jgi:cobalt-zinc-cadmium efflux system protein
LSLNIAYVLIEAGVGVTVGSLALLADAGHNLVDVTGLLVAWGARQLGQRPSTTHRSYGWGKATAMAPLANAVLIIMMMGAIGWEALRRLRQAPDVPGLTVIVVAGIGFFVNTGTALLFARGRQQDLNRRGVYWHMAADAGVSLAVVLGGIGLLWTGWAWLDPALSLIVVTVVLLGTWRLLREAFDLVMDAVPRDIDSEAVHALLQQSSGVLGVHDFHIWAISTTETALSAHVIVSEDQDAEEIIGAAVEALWAHFPIHHVTLQPERTPCTAACGRPGQEKTGYDSGKSL